MNNASVSRIFCITCLLVSANGCSTQAWYEGVKQGAVNQCNSQPPGAREDCLSRLNHKTYDTYNKERPTPD